MRSSETYSGLQRFLLSILPASWAESMERDSRAWQAVCSCGHKRSIWELGGIRWKAAGNPRRRMHCPQCETTSWHTVVKENAPDEPDAHG